ncbi:hypothetical protein V1512DRAFT_197395, partial [Lipomyces arxii]|uniref:uncharacterized protein n=1 Tax=Lipomyces arxii TaxID=56418 RepID=UPI0034CE923E
MDPIAVLPIEIVLIIVQQVTFPSSARLRLVCRSWNFALSHALSIPTSYTTLDFSRFSVTPTTLVESIGKSAGCVFSIAL